MKKKARSLPILPVLAALVALALPAKADTVLLTKSGTLYEVYPSTYGELVSGATSADAKMPVLALRVTAPGAAEPALELVGGTVDQDPDRAWALEYEPDTDTVFVVYTKASGFMTNVQVAMRRRGAWSARTILANPGLYLSLNPRAVVTRQQITDADADGKAVTKMRSIVSLVWWEESGPSQARYAPVFVEDGVLRLDEVEGYNLNELAGATGPTVAGGLPFSAYQFPALQRDPATNGGVLVSFANLADGTQTALRVTFPDDMKALIAEAPEGVSPTAWAEARAHVPVGREMSKGTIPSGIDSQTEVSAFISQGGVTNFYWPDAGSLRYIGSDAKPGEAPKTILLRPDFSAEKAVNALREMTARE